MREEHEYTAEIDVRKHYPDAFVDESWRNGGLYRICAETLSKRGAIKVTPIGGWCTCECGAWASAKNRIIRRDMVETV